MKKKLIVVFVAVILFVSGMTAGVFLYKGASSSKVADIEEKACQKLIALMKLIYTKPYSKTITILPASTPIPTKDLKQTAWIPSWGFKSGVESLKEEPSQFYSISPVWYDALENGDIDVSTPSTLETFKMYCKTNNIKLIPSIAMFDADIFKSVLNNEQYYQNHITTIVDEVVAQDYAGIDLDYESTYLDDKEEYQKFIADLSTELKKHNKLLSITVLAQWGDDIVYPSLKQTRKVQDWEYIADYADEIRIMAYDYSSQVSANPGPISPNPWVEKVLNYAIHKIPPEKIWLGVPLYSYEWEGKKYDPTLDIESTELTSTIQANSYTYDIYIDIINEKNVTKTFDQKLGEGYAEYSCGTNTICTLFYQTPEGIKMKQEIAKKYGIRGVAYWRLGEEGELL